MQWNTAILNDSDFMFVMQEYNQSPAEYNGSHFMSVV